jgi:hypothetical protein
MEKVPLWLQVVMAVFASGVVTAFITGFFNKRKLGADAAKLITDAAASVTQTMRSRLEELEAKDKIRDLEEDAFRVKLELHEEWDRKLVRLIRQIDPTVQIEDPPSLR